MVTKNVNEAQSLLETFDKVHWTITFTMEKKILTPLSS